MSGITLTMSRILGIDVGTATTGWSIIEHDPNATNKIKLIGYGVISTLAALPMPERLEQIHSELSELITKYKPQDIAIESLFFFKNQKTVMTVSQARGVILLAAQQNKLNIFEYTPLQVKSGITGYGRAEKQQVQNMVKMILGMTETPKPDDAADAIAIAITHFHSSQFWKKVSK
jgi:crossover junction endodeoxyribonuclease RuvC